MMPPGTFDPSIIFTAGQSVLCQVEDEVAARVSALAFVATHHIPVFTCRDKIDQPRSFEQAALGVLLSPATFALVPDPTSGSLPSAQVSCLCYVRAGQPVLVRPTTAAQWMAVVAEGIVLGLHNQGHAIGGGGAFLADKHAIQPLSDYDTQIEYLHAGSSPAFQPVLVSPQKGKYLAAYAVHLWATFTAS